MQGLREHETLCAAARVRRHRGSVIRARRLRGDRVRRFVRAANRGSAPCLSRRVDRRMPTLPLRRRRVRDSVLTSCVGLRISIASAALVAVAACTAFEDVPEPKRPRAETDQTEAVDAAARAPTTPAPPQAADESDAASDAAVEAAARTCDGSSSESFCIGDVLHHCSSAGDNVLFCAKFRTHCVVTTANSASCQ
jgi:hypothetical protein